LFTFPDFAAIWQKKYRAMAVFRFLAGCPDGCPAINDRPKPSRLVLSSRTKATGWVFEEKAKQSKRGQGCKTTLDSDRIVC
jgi:hypothetical protein